MMSTPARVAQISSCSTAAARNVSAAQIIGARPESFISRASLPTVVVFPVPLTPTIITTCGVWPLAVGVSASRRIWRISCLTSVRSDSPCVRFALTALTIWSAAATPTSAEISASSSASTVSTSTGRLAGGRLVGLADDLVEALDELFLGARERLLDPVEKTHGYPSTSARCRRSISASTASAGEQRPSRTACICGRRSAARCRVSRRAPAPRPSCARPRPPSACPTRISAIDRPRPSSMPTRRLRLRSPVQVSTRSPRPLRPASVSRLPTFGAGQPRDLREAARDQRGQRVVPETQPLDHARGDRDDVLQRAADLDTRHVVAGVEPQPRPAKMFLHGGRSRLLRRSRENGGRKTTRDFRGEARPREHDRRGSSRRFHPRSPATSAAGCSVSIPFVVLTTIAPVSRCGSDDRTTARSPCDGTATTTKRAPVERGRETGRRRDRVGQRDVRQIATVRPSWRAARRRTRRRAPTAGRRARRARDGRRAPSPSCRRPRIAVVFTPAPRRARSVPVRSRRQLLRWRNRISAALPAADRTTARGSPVSHARAAAPASRRSIRATRSG